MPTVEIDIKKISELKKASESDVAGSNLLIVKSDGQGETMRATEEVVASELSKKMKVSNLTNDKSFQTNTEVAAAVAAHNSNALSHSTLISEIGKVEAIARGKSRGRKYETYAELVAFLAIPANVAELQIGDNFYIVDKGVPDYWWDGVKIQELEVEKVDLSNIYTKPEVNNGFTKKPIVKEVSIPVAAWVEDGSVRKATIEDTDVSADSVVFVYPTLSSEDIASLAGIYSEVTSTATGNFILTSDSAPSDAVSIKYIIFP